MQPLARSRRPGPLGQRGAARRRGLAVAAGLALAMVAGAASWRLLATPELAPAVTYALIDGQRVSSQDLRGKVVLVNFWATSCTTCVKEMPALVETHRRFAARGFETVAVAMSYDRPDYVLHFAKSRELPFKVALDVQGDVAQSFGRVAVTPTSVLIGPDGRVLRRWIGEPDSWPELQALIDSKLPPA